MDLDSGDLVWRGLPRTCGPRIVRHKDQKSFRAVADAESQTPEEERDTDSIARKFAETKESFFKSVADRDAEEQIEAQENISCSNT